MIPNPGQFNSDKSIGHKKNMGFNPASKEVPSKEPKKKEIESKYNRAEKHSNAINGSSKKDLPEKKDKDYEKFKGDYLKKAPGGRYNGYQAPDGSWHGHPQSESAIKAHYKWSKMSKDQQDAHTKRRREYDHYAKAKPKKDIDDHKNLKRKDPYINKKKGPDNDDDNNKGFGGGAKVPRKPKPSPQSPGEYRPIERKVDQDYARRQDRYRVTLAR